MIFKSVKGKNEMEDLYRFWAKSLPEKSLVHHMIDVGSIANALLTDSSIEDTPKEVSYVSSVTGAGNRFGFDLLCIPSKKEKREGKNSRRILLKTEEERVEWLRKKAEQNGFSLLWVREEGGSKVMVKTKHSSTEAWHGGIRFRGELVVLDSR